MTDTRFDGLVVVCDHVKNFLDRMNELRMKNDSSCDVSFNVNGKEFPCHELVLTTASSYFKNMFNGNFRESESRRNITLDDIEPNALEEILNAVYTSIFRITCENAYFIIRGSHMLQLMDIFNVVVSRMKTKCIENIHYLIEICLFAKKIDHEELHSLCIKGIASDFDTISKTDSFNQQISYDVLKSILQHDNFNGDKETLFHTILSWNKHHKCSEDEILILLDSVVSMDNYVLSVPLMAKLIVNNTINYEYHITAGQNNNAEKSTSSGEAGNHNGVSNSDIDLYVYLDVVDVKTGAKGWITLRSKNEFNDYEIINYEPSDFSHRRVKKLRNKLYCFEYDGKGASKFSYFEDGLKQNLTSLSTGTVKEYCDMAVSEKSNKLFIVTQDEKVMMYHCEKSVWIELKYESETDDNAGKKRKYEVLHSDAYPKITFGNNELFLRRRPMSTCKSGIITIIPCETEGTQGIIFKFNVEPNLSYKGLERQRNPAFCFYGEKLVVCGSSRLPKRRTVSLYNMKNSTWEQLQEMKIGRSNHMLVHKNGFLYAIENKPTVPNEKFDIELNKWTFIPTIPQRIYYAPKNLTLATGNVFSCDIE